MAKIEPPHLDSIYRDRWEEFHLADGTVEDSRSKNWRHVNWKNLIKIIVFIKSNKYEFEITSPSHWTFMNFRWGGSEPVYDGNGKFTHRRQINLWTIGWTDKKMCYLTDIDFKTGKIVTKYEAPLSQFIRHLHPRILYQGLIT